MTWSLVLKRWRMRSLARIMDLARQVKELATQYLQEVKKHGGSRNNSTKGK